MYVYLAIFALAALTLVNASVATNVLVKTAKPNNTTNLALAKDLTKVATVALNASAK
ncbi:hypothetical protein CU098_013106 [Rhizopus stolonifer]|uniref:Uncharacterized protein n=1 Tax=Rhizopus stolonifer TaxID=4846 RepID=A0A367KW00_RHIST|nr:hypothetical protein CU098_013106 [Rhizopus stolonifer]